MCQPLHKEIDRIALRVMCRAVVLSATAAITGGLWLPSTTTNSIDTITAYELPIINYVYCVHVCTSG
jgi:hypothetical protein